MELEFLGNRPGEDWFQDSIDIYIKGRPIPKPSVTFGKMRDTKQCPLATTQVLNQAVGEAKIPHPNHGQSNSEGVGGIFIFYMYEKFCKS